MSCRLAIVAMDVVLGDQAGLDLFDRRIYEGLQPVVALSDARKAEAGVAAIASPFGFFSKRSDYCEDYLDKSLVAYLEKTSSLVQLPTVLIVIASSEINSSQAKADKFNVNALLQVSSLQQAMQIAEHLLLKTDLSKASLTQELLAQLPLLKQAASHNPKQVIIAGSHQLPSKMDSKSLAFVANGIENAKPKLSLDVDEMQFSTSQAQGEGAGFVALKCEDEVVDLSSIVAYIEASAHGHNVAEVAADALDSSQVQAKDIEYLEATCSECAEQASREFEALAQIYSDSMEERTVATSAASKLTCAFGSIKPTVGNCGEITPLLALIKTAHCLQQRYLPAVPQWQAPANESAWNKTPFYVATETLPWFENKSLNKRLAALNVVRPHAELRDSSLGSTTESLVAHFILSDNTQARARTNQYFALASWHLIPLAGNSLLALQQSLGELKQDVMQSDDLKQCALNKFNAFKQQAKSDYVVAILGEDRASLLSEIELMSAGLEIAFKDQVERKTPKGSYFTPKPAGAEAGVGFVYPGIGAPYVDFGRDLFHLFPAAFNALDSMSRDAGKSVKENLLYPRSQKKLSAAEKKGVERNLKINLHLISECGVGMGYMLTKAFRNSFNLQPAAGVGYSMGEISMYVALDAWADPGCLSEPLADHPTFKHNITGELFALREHWNLPAPSANDGVLWDTFSMRGNAAEVQAAVDEEEKVFLTIINTPDNLLIGGDPEACQRVIKKLGTRAMSLGLASAIHSAPAKAEYDRIFNLYHIETAERSSAKFYSTSVYQQVPHRTKAIAHSIAKSFTEQVDFPRLINKMVDDGVKVFVEMGADRSCSTYIEKILSSRSDGVPHVCVPVNAKGTPDTITLLRAFAKLVSHQVNIDISPLFYKATNSHG